MHTTSEWRTGGEKTIPANLGYIISFKHHMKNSEHQIDHSLFLLRSKKLYISKTIEKRSILAVSDRTFKKIIYTDTIYLPNRNTNTSSTIRCCAQPPVAKKNIQKFSVDIDPFVGYSCDLHPEL